MMPPDFGKPIPPSGCRRRLPVLSFALALTGLLSAVTPPRVHAQNPTPGWDGTVEVNTTLLEIEKGKSTSYSLRLTQAPTADGWWVRVHVDGAVRDGGDYKGLSWVPSVGWGFDEGENPWRTISIKADEDAVAGTEVTFEHEVWDHDANCPVHNVGRVTVRIVEERPAEPLPELSIRDASRVTEGDAASFEVRLSKPSDQAVTVRYETEGGTALEDTDFDGASDTLRFNPNDRVKTIEVQTTDDALDEPDENFTVKLTGPSGATLDDDTGTGTIRDDDDAPKLTIGDAEVTEGSTARFEVTLSDESGQDVTVRVRTSNGTARSGSDYAAVDRTLTFTAGDTQETIEVETTADDDYEEDEDFTVRLSSPNGATIEDDTGDGTITNDDSPPRLSIDDVTVEEGVRADFEVTLSAQSSLPVTVQFATMDDTAIDGSDYTATRGTLTFSPGTKTRTIRVSTREDQAKEPEEYFTVELSDPEGATIAEGTGTGTITDDDEAALPSLRIEDTTVTEGGTASFTVKLSVESEDTVTVGFYTSDGTARAGSDYTAISDGTLTFSAGTTERQATVATLQDTDYEGSETFTVRLHNPDEATLEEDTGTGTIEDDDPAPEVSIGNVTVEEGGTAEFTVTLDRASTIPVRVPYETKEGPAGEGVAVEGTDYDRTSGTLTFQPGTRSLPIRVRTREDTADEPDETFTVELGEPEDGTLGSPSTGTGTIEDDDVPPQVSIGNAPAVTEGDTALFPVTLSVASGKMVTVMYRTRDGTATASSDYMATSGELEFEPGTTRLTVAVPTSDDRMDEAEENFTVVLSAPTEATLKEDADTAQGTIRDNDDPLHLSIADAEAVTEGGTATFTVTLSEQSAQEVTVEYETRKGTATAGPDYTAAADTLTFTAGQTTRTIEVATVNDNLPEDLEQFTVELSSASGATIEDGSGSVTIIDDDEGGTPSLRIADASATEGAGTVDFTVTMSVAASAEVKVDYRTMGGTAVEGPDYTGKSGTLTFTAGGATTQTISVAIEDDSIREPDESFSVILSNPSGATLADDTATGTITDNDSSQQPELSILDATVSEGETALFRVRLSVAVTETVTVNYRTVDGTATEGTDYTPTLGSLEFRMGTIEQTIAVPTVEDGTAEETEMFTVELLRPATGATLEEDATATGTITDDDGGGGGDGGGGVRRPTLTIRDAETVTEGDSAEFVVTLSAESQQVVSVAYETQNGTAVAGSDYESATGTLRFEAGDTEQKIAVATLEDDTGEGTETFRVTLSDPEGATINDGTATGRIIDAGSLSTLVIADAAPVAEGDTAEFVVTLSPPSEQPVTVAFTTEDGSAIEGSDYTPTAGTLRFEPGDTQKEIAVPTVEDDTGEETETFTVTLSSPSGATLEDDTGAGTIADDDGGGGGGAVPTLTIADAAPAAEGGTAEFVVTLSAASGQAVTVAFATADGTAKADSDYTRTTGTLRFEPGDTRRIVEVPVLDDEVLEQAENFSVELSEPVGATLADGSGTGTITDNDEGRLPALAMDDAAPVVEGVTALFPVRLSAPTEQVVTVTFATADGTAASAADYTAASGTLTFEPGTTRQTIEVATLDDDTEEPEELFTVALTDPAGATLEDDAGTGTIRDNDGDTGDFPALSIADATPVVEGRTAEFPVTLSVAVEHVVTVSYATADGTAKAGLDYTSTTGTLRLEPGDTTRTIRVPVLDDETLEETEDFTVTLGGPAGATLADPTGRGTIDDDDEGKLPALSIGDAAPVTEGETALFAVTLSAAVDQPVSVAFATAGGTAVEGADYTATEGTLTFQPGTTRRTIEVATRQDEFVESEEGFAVGLSDATGAGLEDDTGAGTIVDDDLVEGLPALAIGDAPPVSEGGEAAFVVTLSPASEQVVRVSYRTLDGTAAAGLDYTAAEGTLRFEPGETTRTIAVTTLADELVEGAERFTVELSDPVAATVADPTGVGTITEIAERIGTVSRTVLPELGRALAFSAATCRFDGGLSGPMNRGGSRGRGGYLSLSHGLTSDRLTSAPLTSDRLTSDPRISPMRERLTLERALGDSSFLMPVQDEEGGAGRFAAWGCGDYRHLSGGGDGGAVAWNGEAFSVNLGADVRLGSNTLAGLSVSRSRGSFDYRAGGSHGEAGGAYDLRLTGVHPYLGWSVSPDLDVWGMAGHAWGELRIEDDLAAGPLMSAATLDSGAVGVNGRLLARGTTSVTLKGEGALARLGIAGDGGLVDALAVNMRRVRLSTEASHDLLFSSGASLTPWGELGLRHDGGDGETGAGLEVGGGLRYRNLQGWTTEGYGRWLAVHQGTLREWGFGAVVRYDPGAAGRGPSLSLMPGWGDTASGVRRLWERGATDPTVPRAGGSHWTRSSATASRRSAAAAR